MTPFCAMLETCQPVDAAATARGVPKGGDEQMTYDLLIKGGTVVAAVVRPDARAMLR